MIVASPLHPINPQPVAAIDLPMSLEPTASIVLMTPSEYTANVSISSLEPAVNFDPPLMEPATRTDFSLPEPAPSLELLSKLPTCADLQPASWDNTGVESDGLRGSEAEAHIREQPEMQQEGWSIDPDLWATYLAALSPSMLSDDDSYQTSSSDTASAVDDCEMNSPSSAHEEPEKPAPLGNSRSAIASRKLKASMQDGTFCINDVRLANFKRKIFQVHANAAFDLSLPTWRVFHPPCGKWVALPEVYHVFRYSCHHKKCKAATKSTASDPRNLEAEGSLVRRGHSALAMHAKPAALSRTLHFFVEKSGWEKQGKMNVEVGSKEPAVRGARSTSPAPTKRPSLRCSLPVPCAGITEQHAPGVSKYLQRTGALGGGSRSLLKIAYERYGEPYAELSDAQRAVVSRQQRHEQTWRNNHALPAVFSVKCKQTIPVKHGHVPAHPICVPCLSIARSKRFKAALRVPMPSPEHYRHLNYQYRNESLGHLYARSVGLQELVESGVSNPIFRLLHSTNLVWD